MFRKIARQIGVTEQDVIYMNRRLGGDASLNAFHQTVLPLAGIANPRTRRQRSPRARSSITAARRCPMRSSCSTSASGTSFEARRLAEDPITLAELAEEFGVSRERVRQIGVCAFEKVQKAVKNRVATMESPAPLPVR